MDVDWLIIALVVTGFLGCVAVPLAVIFVVLLWLDIGERRAETATEENLARPPAMGARIAFELEVDPHDAAHTEHLLQELIATSRLEDW